MMPAEKFADRLALVHPGEVFEEFLKPLGLSQNRLALDIRTPARRINEIVLGKRRVAGYGAAAGALFHVAPVLAGFADGL